MIQEESAENPPGATARKPILNSFIRELKGRGQVVIANRSDEELASELEEALNRMREVSH